MVDEVGGVGGYSARTQIGHVLKDLDEHPPPAPPDDLAYLELRWTARLLLVSQPPRPLSRPLPRPPTPCTLPPPTPFPPAPSPVCAGAQAPSDHRPNKIRKFYR